MQSIGSSLSFTTVQTRKSMFFFKSGWDYLLVSVDVSKLKTGPYIRIIRRFIPSIHVALIVPVKAPVV